MFTLDHVVPWGRSFDEYRAMFGINDADLAGRILGCGDGPEGGRKGRYVAAQLPSLPFGDREFDRALCSHLLFLYSDHLGEALHHSSLLELVRVAREVRVFPLLALGGARSPFVDGCVDLLRGSGYEVSIERVAYEFQRGGNQMMRVRRSSSNPAKLLQPH